MNKTILFSLIFLGVISEAAPTPEDIETSFESGLYNLTKKMIRSQAAPYSYKQEALLLAMGDFSPYEKRTSLATSRETQESSIESTEEISAESLPDHHAEAALLLQTPETYIKKLIINKNPIGLIIKALWHVNTPIFDAEGPLFPQQYTTLLQDNRSIQTGINILTDLYPTNKHAAYMLGCLFLRPEIEDMSIRRLGNIYLKTSAQLGHLDAQNSLKEYGIDWNDKDQFGDHCKIWFFFPNFSFNKTCIENIRTCIGCGPNKDDHGWVDCNCGLCGYSTELNGASIAKYCTKGFMSCLTAAALPIRLSTTILTTGTTILQALGSPATLPVSIAATGCATLSAFIKEETSAPIPSKPPITKQPTSVTFNSSAV